MCCDEIVFVVNEDIFFLSGIKVLLRILDVVVNCGNFLMMGIVDCVKFY